MDRPYSKQLIFTDKTRCRRGNVCHIANRDVWELMDRYGLEEIPLE